MPSATTDTCYFSNPQTPGKAHVDLLELASMPFLCIPRLKRPLLAFLEAWAQAVEKSFQPRDAARVTSKWPSTRAPQTTRGMRGQSRISDMHAQDQLSSLCPLLPYGNQDPASSSSPPLPRDAEAKLKKSGAPYPDASPLDACTVKQPPLQAHHVTLQSDSRPQNKIPASSLSRRVPCPSGHVGLECRFGYLVIVTNMKRLLG